MAKDKIHAESARAVIDNALKSATQFAEIEMKQFSTDSLENIPSLPTGVPELNSALGIGGLPYGCIVEVFGQTGGGKTWFAKMCACEAQKRGQTILWCDVEGGFNPIRAQQLGLNLLDDTFVYIQGGSGEDIMDLIVKAIASDKFHLIVADSVAAMSPRKELDGEISDTDQPGLHARMMSKGLRKIRNAIVNKPVIVIFINQIRSAIAMTRYGPSETTTGGKALPFYAGVRIRLSARTGKEFLILDNNKKIIGNHSHAKLVKTRYGVPYEECDFPIYFVDHKRDYWLEFLTKAKKADQVLTYGKTYYYPADRQKYDIKTTDVKEFQDWLITNDLIRKILSICKIENVEEEFSMILDSIEDGRNITDEDRQKQLDSFKESLEENEEYETNEDVAYSEGEE